MRMPALSASAPKTLYQFSPYGSLKPMKPIVFTPFLAMCLISAAAIRSSFCVVLKTQRFFASTGSATACVPTVASSGTLASAMMSRMANAFGVVDGPINASTLCSPISFLAFCTARVVSPPSSSWIYSTDASPTRAGSNAPVFFWGMPIAEVGPVAETINPILTCAEAEARPKASARATISARTSIRGSPDRSAREGSNAKPNAPSEQGRMRSYPLRGRVTGSPCPLKIVAAKMPGHIDHLSDEIEAGNTRCGHCFRRQLARIHSAKGDLGLVITQGPGGQHGPVVEPRRNLAQPLVVELAHRTRRLLRLAPLLRKPSGQALRQHGV